MSFSKSTLERRLTLEQIRAAIVQHQPRDAPWATSQTRTKRALLQKASLRTLLRAALALEQVSDRDTAALAWQLARLEGGEPVSVAVSSVATASAPATVAAAEAIPPHVAESRRLLQEHLQVLKAAGLITEEEAEKINSFAKLCPRNLAKDGQHVFDVLNQENFDDESDIVRLSDKNCYSKSSMQDFVRQGTVDTDTGRPVLPLSQQAIKDADYNILGMPLPTAQQRRAAREQQQMRSFEQLSAGDVEAWRARRTRAREEFAFFLTDPMERERLARELGVAVARLAPARVAAVAPVAAPVAAPIVPASVLQITLAVPAVGALQQRQTISAGYEHSLGILEDGTVVGWGRDHYGQASGGQALATNGRKFVSVSAGFNHSLGLLDDGSVVGWGKDYDGQATGGQALATGGRKFVAIAAGSDYSLGLLNDGSVVGWGADDDGEATGGQALATAGRKFLAVSAGIHHSLGLLDDGTVVGWGDDEFGVATGGQELATEGRKFVAISAGGEHSLGLLDDGSVVGWGVDSIGEEAADPQSLATNGRKFVAISAGLYFSLGLLNDGSVVGWGTEEFGDTTYGRISDGQELATNGRKFVSISAGSDHSLGMLNDGSVVGWGGNNYEEAKGADAAAGGRKFMLPSQPQQAAPAPVAAAQ